MFKVGDKVCGERKRYNPLNDDYPVENNTHYVGTICTDFKDGSYAVTLKNGTEVLIELYFSETMRLATPLDEVIE